MVVSSAMARPFAFACQVGADAPFEVNTKPAVPVVPANDKVPLNLKSVNVPASGVVPPIVTLFMVDAVVGFTVNAPAGAIETVPVPVGFI